jgi:hypothetical protein
MSIVLCIAGSRNLPRDTGEQYVRRAVSEALRYWGLTVADIVEGVSGTANGADTYGERRFKAHGIPVRRFPAAWDDVDAPGAQVRVRRDGVRYNALAGHWRNSEMAEYLSAFPNNAGRCVIVYAGAERSGGSAHMYNECGRRGVEVFEYFASR